MAVISKIREAVNKEWKDADMQVTLYRKQVVAGTNYFLKILLSKSVLIEPYYETRKTYLHARIFKSLPCKETPPQLVAIREYKESGDALEYF